MVGLRNKANRVHFRCFSGLLAALGLRFVEIGKGLVIGSLGSGDIAHQQPHASGLGFVDEQVCHGSLRICLEAVVDAVLEEGTFNAVAALEAPIGFGDLLDEQFLAIIGGLV